MKYIARLVAEFEVEAENIAHARKVAKSVRSIGQRVGGSFGRHDRDFIRYSVSLLNERVEVARK